MGENWQTTEEGGNSCYLGAFRAHEGKAARMTIFAPQGWPGTWKQETQGRRGWHCKGRSLAASRTTHRTMHHAPRTTHHGRLSPRVAGRVCLPRTHLLYSPCSCLVFIFPTDALDLEMQSTAKMEIKDEARKRRLSWDPQVLTPALLLKCLGQACTSQERTEGKQPV